MKLKFIILIGVTVLVSVVVWVASPMHVRDRFVGLLTFMKDDRRCFNVMKRNLRDPDTAYLVGSYVWTKAQDTSVSGDDFDDPFLESYDALLRIEVAAKNGFGAYDSAYLACPLREGVFDAEKAELYRIHSNLRRSSDY